MSENTEMTVPRGSMTYGSVSERIQLQLDTIPTEVPYASNILPVNVPRKYSMNICIEPMRETVDDEEDGRSVVL